MYTHLSTDIYTGACSHSCRRSRGGDEPALPTGARQPQRNRNINKTQQTISSASRRYERRVMMRARKTIYIYIYIYMYIYIYIYIYSSFTRGAVSCIISCLIVMTIVVIAQTSLRVLR